jgi:hypothetical protein
LTAIVAKVWNSTCNRSRFSRQIYIVYPPYKNWKMISKI